MVKSPSATKKFRKEHNSLIKKFILHALTFNLPICYLSLKIASQTAHSCSVLVGWLSMEMASTDAHTKRLTIYAYKYLCDEPIYNAGTSTDSKLTKFSL